ncbi:unnamed protein product [Peronospora farinosa]|uniref:Uncharacterized protein n=1 Tax=Peronospora farinosa TaxID=134698 RepID=A0AAV0UEX6_9STRA|nr:unnamed protein product [Peronospora farinosa]
MILKTQITCLEETSDGKTACFYTIQPMPVSSPSAKILYTRRAGDPTQLSPTIKRESLPEEAQGLKDLLLSSSSHQVRSRFSFSKLRRVVIPPVQIPPALATPNAFNNIVAGAKIPMTKAMWTRHRARLMQRLPGRVDEKVAR